MFHVHVSFFMFRVSCFMGETIKNKMKRTQFPTFWTFCARWMGGDKGNGQDRRDGYLHHNISVFPFIGISRVTASTIALPLHLPKTLKQFRIVSMRGKSALIVSANKRAAPTKQQDSSKRRRFETENERSNEDSESDVNEDDEYCEDEDSEDDGSNMNNYEIDEEDDGLRPVEGYAIGLDAGDKSLNDAEELQSTMAETQLNFICLDLEIASKLMDELSLDNSGLSDVVVGKINLNKQSEQKINDLVATDNPIFYQYAFAAHLGLQAVMIQLPSPGGVSPTYFMQLCRLLTNMLNKFPPTSPQVWIRIESEQWALWDSIRYGMDHHPHVFVALDMVSAVDRKTAFEPPIIRRWLAEPIKAVLLNTAQLTIDDDGTAARKQSKSKSKASQQSLNETVVLFLRKFFDFKMHFIMVPSLSHMIPNNPASMVDSDILEKCMAKLQSEFTTWRELPLHENEIAADSMMLDQNFSFSFRDKLQTPLDPLHQNLDMETYRVMEEDPIKYQRYEMALIAAMKDLKASPALSGGKSIRVLVVGPGRGPLIASSLLAGAVNKVPVEVIAIEKNRNAVRTLRHRFASYVEESSFSHTAVDMKNKAKGKDKSNGPKEKQESTVRIIEGDMRDQVHEFLLRDSVHIIVSELLGSFADNEASPECLYAIEHVLNTNYGVMIPQSYTSYLMPVAATSLWQQARVMFSSHGGKNQHQQQGLDYPYVVHFHSHATYGGESQPAFQFLHPSYGKNINIPTEASLFNSSYSSKEEESISHKVVRLGNQANHLTFNIEQDTTIHGLAGYFHCTLYKDIVFSTVPEQMMDLSPGMFSWFPMYFPITLPMKVSAGDKVDVHMWRCVDGNRMWYEWTMNREMPSVPGTVDAVVPTFSALQNSLGRAFHVQL